MEITSAVAAHSPKNFISAGGLHVRKFQVEHVYTEVSVKSFNVKCVIVNFIPLSGADAGEHGEIHGVKKSQRGQVSVLFAGNNAVEVQVRSRRPNHPERTTFIPRIFHPQGCPSTTEHPELPPVLVKAESGLSESSSLAPGRPLQPTYLAQQSIRFRYRLVEKSSSPRLFETRNSIVWIEDCAVVLFR